MVIQKNKLLILFELKFTFALLRMMLNKNIVCCYHDNENESVYLYVTFNSQLLGFLKKKNMDDLMCFLNNPESINILKKFTYEVLVEIISNFNTYYSVRKKKRISFCVELINFLAIYCEPSELLLYIIEQIELTKSNYHSNFLLKPLKICLFRCRNFLSATDTCIDYLRKTLSDLPDPNEENNEVYDHVVEDIVLSYLNISKFVNDLLTDLDSSFSDSKTCVNTKYLILDLLLSMFGKPICFMNLNSANHQIIFKNILKNIFFIESDIVYFFRFINYKNFFKYWTTNKNYQFLSDQCALSLKVDDLSLCNFYWTVSHKVLQVNIFQVYRPCYIVYNFFNVSNYLMFHCGKSKVFGVKALDLVRYALNIVKNFFIPFESLDLCIHNELIQNLIYLILNGDTFGIQKFALDNFIGYINGFNSKSKYVIIEKLVCSNYHPAIVAIVIRILKNVAAEALKNIEAIEYSDGLFSGLNLQVLIFKICTLKNGTETDLIEISDQLISTLNFILFLIIRDKKNSGILDIFEKTQYKFLKSVEKAALLQKTQWTTEFNWSREKKAAQYDEEQNMSISKKLSFLSLDQKCQMYNQAINILLIIENILHRIYELVNMKR